MKNHTTEAGAILFQLGQHAKAQGLTQTKIAKRAGISQSAVSLFFQGKSNCNLATFLALAEACGLTPAEAISLQPTQTITFGGHTYTLAEGS